MIFGLRKPRVLLERAMQNFSQNRKFCGTGWLGAREGGWHGISRRVSVLRLRAVVANSRWLASFLEKTVVCDVEMWILHMISVEN